jgi:hypothetical protein
MCFRKPGDCGGVQRRAANQVWLIDIAEQNRAEGEVLGSGLLVRLLFLVAHRG